MSPTGSAPEGYLDAASGEPLHPAAREALLAAADQAWADPSGITPPARRARILLDGAIASIAHSVGVDATRVHPVHGDPALAALDQMLTQPVPPTLVVSAVEREVILRRALETGGRVVQVDSTGRVRLDHLDQVLQDAPGPVALSFQAANGEVGTLQPVAEISALATSVAAPLHLDYQGAIGRVPLVPADYISAGASGWGGPRGVGIVIAGERTSASRLDGRTVALPILIAAAAALEARVADDGHEDARLRALIDRVRAAVQTIPDADLAGDPIRRLPHVLTASFLYLDGQVLMDALAGHGIYIGSGSACIASRVEPSHVLTAMGRLSHGNIRLALPHGTRAGDVDRLIALLPGIVASIRTEYGVS